jgi:hypothetical protein
MGYLSTRALDGLKAYAYKPSGYTILDHLHAPFLNCAKKRLRGKRAMRSPCGVSPICLHAPWWPHAQGLRACCRDGWHPI